MPIIKSQDEREDKEAWRIRLRQSICEELRAYCEWAHIKQRDYFLEQACLHIFDTDKEWLAHKAGKKKSFRP